MEIPVHMKLGSGARLIGQPVRVTVEIVVPGYDTIACAHKECICLMRAGLR